MPDEVTLDVTTIEENVTVETTAGDVVEIQVLAPTGTAATVAVGTTTTGAAGTNASVTNSGTTSAAVFNFTIPRGDTGAAGASGGSSTAWRYKAKTNATSGYPTNGHLLWNNATQNAATEILVSHLDDEGTDVELLLSFFAQGQKIFIQNRDDSSQNQVWEITGTPTVTNPNTSTAYYTFPVTLVSYAGSPFSNSHSILFGSIAAAVNAVTSATTSDGTANLSLGDLEVVGGEIYTDGEYSHIYTQGDGAEIFTIGTDAIIYTQGADAHISTSGDSATIYTSGASGSIYTTGANAGISTVGANATMGTQGTNATISTAGSAAHIQTSHASAAVKSTNFAAVESGGASLVDGSMQPCLTWSAGGRNLTIPSGTATTFNTTSYTYGTGAAAAHRTALGLTTLATTTPAANVATFLETPSSANLAAAVTDETGTGALVFGTSPTIDAPTISGSAAFTSTTRPTSAGTGTPAATSLITRADFDQRIITGMLNMWAWPVQGTTFTNVLGSGDFNGGISLFCGAIAASSLARFTGASQPPYASLGTAGLINWGSPIYFSFIAYSGAIASSGINRVYLGLSHSSTTVQDLNVKGVGIKTIGSSIFFQVFGASLVTSASSVGTLTSLAQSFLITGDGTGTYNLFINGVLASTLSGGPTGTSADASNRSIQAMCSTSDTFPHRLTVNGAKLWL